MSAQTNSVDIDSSFDRLAETALRIKRERDSMADALLDVLEYFEDREDVLDGDYGMPKPNDAMRYASRIRDVLAAAGEKV